MNTKIMSAFKKILKGNKGEEEVLQSIIEILRKNGDDNYYLIPKTTLKDVTASHEIDLLLLHPIFGLYAIEVKNWSNLNITQENNPFSQANNYQDMLMSILNEEFNKLPINVEYRVVFPNISKAKASEFFENHQYYKNYKNHVFFKEDLKDSEIFKKFFNSSNSIIPNKKEFTKIAKIFIPTDKLKNEQIIPIITKDEILFFDQKQLSVLNGYTGGFRIIRGVAGTGKTIILTNFISNKLQEHRDEKFLVLCFNRKLANELKNSFSKEQLKNIKINSVFEFLREIHYNFSKVGITKETSIEKNYEIFETTDGLAEFRMKLREYLNTNPIDYFLVDETQDLPAGFVRMIYEEINDMILFIDEAQRFYPYTMKDISNIFYHKKFKQTLSMTGRVKNLKNIYRTPSNIAKCAFDILSFDTTLNKYYRNLYIDNFTSKINFVLEDGKIEIKDFNNFDNLRNLIKTFENDEEYIILTNSNSSKTAIETIIKDYKTNIKVMTIQSVKGLEAQNIVVHNFDLFMLRALSNKETFYKQLYVIITRVQSKLILSISNKDKIENNKLTKPIYDILKSYESKTKYIVTEKEDHKLSKIKPILNEVKEGVELIVTGAELFGVIAGLFGGLSAI